MQTEAAEYTLLILSAETEGRRQTSWEKYSSKLTAEVGEGRVRGDSNIGE